MTLALLFVLSGCWLQPRPAHVAYGQYFYKFKFDSSMTIVVGPRLVSDTAPQVLKHVVEIGGRALSFSPDTFAIAPSYVLTLDVQRPGEGRTIRRNTRNPLPYFVLIPVKTGIRIEHWNIGPSRLKEAAPEILGLLTSLLYVAFHRW